MPRKPALPCGIYFCPVPMRILYPLKTVSLATLMGIYGCQFSEIERRAHKLGIFDQRPHRRVMIYSPAAFRAAWADPDLSVVEIGKRFGIAACNVGQHAKRLGLPQRPRGAQRGAYGAGFDWMWRNGVATKVMAAVFDCHPDSILREALRRGLPRRKRGTARPCADDPVQIALARDAVVVRMAFAMAEMVDAPGRGQAKRAA